MRRLLLVLVAVGALLGMLLGAPGQASAATPDPTAAIVALQGEVLALVALHAYPGTVPPRLHAVYDEWSSSLRGKDANEIVGDAIDADARGVTALAKLRREGFTVTPAVAQALGSFGDDNVDALRDRRPIAISGKVYADALAALGRAGGGPEDDTSPWITILVTATLAILACCAVVMVIALRRRAHSGFSPSNLPQDRRRSLTDDSLTYVLDAARRLNSALDPDAVIAVALDESLTLANGDRSGYTPVEEAPERGAVCRVLTTGQPASATVTEPVLGDDEVAVIAVPVIRSGQVAGALWVVRSPNAPFTPNEQDLVSRLSTLVAGALEAAERHGGLTKLSLTDGLTSLANRRRLDRDLSSILADGRVAVGFIMIDIDHFKSYNDTNGHVAGDAVLQQVATIMEREVRPSDVVYRYGGEEFCVLLPGATAAEAETVAERLRAAVEAADFEGAATQPGGRVTVSVGLAMTDRPDPDEVTRRADAALYTAKHDGRNRVAIAPVG